MKTLTALISIILNVIGFILIVIACILGEVIYLLTLPFRKITAKPYKEFDLTEYEFIYKNH